MNHQYPSSHTQPSEPIGDRSWPLKGQFVLVYKLGEPLTFTLVSYPACSSTLSVEAICLSESSVNFQRTTQLYIPDASSLHNHCCEALKSYFLFYCFLGCLSTLSLSSRENAESHKTVSTGGAQHTEIPLPRDEEPLHLARHAPSSRTAVFVLPRAATWYRLCEAKQRTSPRAAAANNRYPA
jgi:hypothetical protein